MTGFQRGDLIVLSKPFVHVLNNSERGKRCDHCFLKNNDLKRCSKCSFLYFCNRECQKESWDIHKTECKYIAKALPNVPTASLRLISQILIKIKKYGMDEPSETVHGRRMTFRTLMSHATEILQDLKSCSQMIALIGTLNNYISFANVPKPSEFVEIFGKMCINTFSICDSEMQSIGSGLYLSPSMFDHSCEPDAEVVFEGTNLAVRAICDIPHRDVSKIYISYIEQLQLLKDRQKNLKDQYFFCCQCTRCTLPDYENLISKVLEDKQGIEEFLKESEEELTRIKSLKRKNKSPSTLYETCMNQLEKQNGVLADTHILNIKILEIAFDACLSLNMWAEALAIGNQITEPYRSCYGPYHPFLGIHLFKMGKIQNFLAHTTLSEEFLLQAEEVLKVTHGVQHPLYQDLLKLIYQCQVETQSAQDSER